MERSRWDPRLFRLAARDGPTPAARVSCAGVESVLLADACAARTEQWVIDLCPRVCCTRMFLYVPRMGSTPSAIPEATASGRSTPGRFDPGAAARYHRRLADRITDGLTTFRSAAMTRQPRHLPFRSGALATKLARDVRDRCGAPLQQRTPRLSGDVTAGNTSPRRCRDRLSRSRRPLQRIPGGGLTSGVGIAEFDHRHRCPRRKRPATGSCAFGDGPAVAEAAPTSRWRSVRRHEPHAVSTAVDVVWEPKT